MSFNTGFPNDSRDTLSSMPKKPKDEIVFNGITFLLTPTANGYRAAIKDSDGKYGEGATKSMAIGNCVLRNQD